MGKEFVKVLILLFILTLFTTTSEQKLINISLVSDRRMTYEKDGADEVNNLGFRLLRVLSHQKKEDNIFFSPLSIGESLRILLLGAKGNSARQISKALNITPKVRNKKQTYYRTVIKTLQKHSRKKHRETLMFSNKLWIQKGLHLREEFKAKAEHFLKAEVEKINFKGSAHASKLINSWVKRKTHSRIKDLLSDGDISMSTRMLLMSTLYFKEQWKERFNPSLTKQDDFYLSETKTIPVKMMATTSNFQCATCAELDSKVLEIPYASDKGLSMIIILPNKLEGIKELRRKLHYKVYTKCLKHLSEPSSNKKVDLYLPRFRLHGKLELSKSLQASAFGIRDIFDQKKANLYGISRRKVFLSGILHEADMKVNEQGTEATATSATEITERATTQGFVVDHPFVFLIREKKFGTVIFIGSVHKPIH